MLKETRLVARCNQSNRQKLKSQRLIAVESHPSATAFRHLQEPWLSLAEFGKGGKCN